MHIRWFEAVIATAIMLWVVVGVVACRATSTKTLAPATDAAPGPEAVGRLEVRLLSADATYTMSRLELVGAQVQFDLTLRIGPTLRTSRFGFDLGGASNAWDETHRALRQSFEAFPKGGARYVLWAGLDADQWWDSPDSTAFLRSIPAGTLTQL